MKEQIGRTIKDMFRKSIGREEGVSNQVLTERLIGSFSAIIEILERENDFLKKVQLSKVQDLLPEKTAALEGLRVAYHAFSEGGDYSAGVPNEVKDLSNKFNAVAQENTILLDASLEAQKAVMKMLVDSAAQSGFSGYGSKGEINAGSPKSIIAHSRDA